MAANFTSPMTSARPEWPVAPGSSGAALEGDTLVSLDFVHLVGRHLSTATTDALHGWT